MLTFVDKVIGKGTYSTVYLCLATKVDSEMPKKLQASSKRKFSMVSAIDVS